MCPSDVTEFTTSGEKDVYAFFRDAAKPDTSVFCWYTPNLEGREPDFILASLKRGVFIVEVKDWMVSQIVQADTKFFTLDMGGKDCTRKHPALQAKEYGFQVLNIGRRLAGQHNLSYPVDWLVAFPHMTRQEMLDAKLDRIIDMDHVLCWDELNPSSPMHTDVGAFDAWLEKHVTPIFNCFMTMAELEALRQCIFPVVRIDLPRRGGVSVQENVVVTLDHDQENLARTMGPGATLVEGPAGCGKTLILARQAANLLERGLARRVLVTCFNLSLVGYVRRLLSAGGTPFGANGVEVLPFYELCERVLGEGLAHSRESRDYYDLVLKMTLEALERDHPLKGHWDTVLVDEGQDFTRDMAKVILDLLPEKGTLTVVEDDNQRLYEGTDSGSAWKSLDIPNLKVMRMTRRYRNTKAIARFAARALGGRHTNMELVGARGEDPAFLFAPDVPSLVDGTACAVARLVRDGAPMSEIAVLYTRTMAGDVNLPKALSEAVEARGVLARWGARDERTKRDYDVTTDSVSILTVHSAKGLDFAYVFLLGLDGLDPESSRDRRLAYVGITRARELVTVCATSRSGLAGELAR